MVRLVHGYLFWQLDHIYLKKKRLNSLEDTGSKHSGEVEGSHTVFLVVALHKGEEVAEVAEEAAVDVRKLLEQVFHVGPRDVITALYRHTTTYQNKSKVKFNFLQSLLFPVQRNRNVWLKDFSRKVDKCSSTWRSHLWNLFTHNQMTKNQMISDEWHDQLDLLWSRKKSNINRLVVSLVNSFTAGLQQAVTASSTCSLLHLILNCGH